MKETVCLVSIPYKYREHVIVPTWCATMSNKQKWPDQIIVRQYLNFYHYIKYGTIVAREDVMLDHLRSGPGDDRGRLTDLCSEWAKEAYPEGTNINYKLIFEDV